MNDHAIDNAELDGLDEILTEDDESGEGKDETGGLAEEDEEEKEPEGGEEKI